MSDTDFVVVHTAQSFPEAKILAGLLESEGVTAKVPGSELTDEFGMAMKMAGSANVIVLERDLEKAKDIVAAWEAGPDGPQGAPDGS